MNPQAFAIAQQASFPVESIPVEELMEQLRTNFPNLYVRMSGKLFSDRGTLWTGVHHDHVFHDGKQIFMDDSSGPIAGYDGGVHCGFTAWLEARGWYLENHDGESYVICAIDDVRDMQVAMQQGA